ncbi:MAG: hypothetical protein IT269_07910, partial [Saprospiraceae bacterium]|nr:hypothetical protein [Saprospiraceae bacterium]
MKHSYCFLLLLISFTLSAQRNPSAPAHGSYLSKTKSFESNKSLLHAYTTSNPQNKASKLAQLNQEALKYLLTGFILDEITGGQWAPSSKSEFTYDDAGRNISYTGSAWDGDVWIKVYKETFQYVPNNTTVTKIEYEYLNDVETPSYKYELVYNANGNLTSLYSYGWEAATNAWANG